jgi:hypothetical protein
VTLTASSGSNYLWSNNSTTQSITVDASNTYSVTVTSGGCSGSASISVTVNSSPAQPVININGSTLSSSSADIYEWYLDGNTTGFTSQQINVTQNGCYSVKITDANGCSALSDTSCVYITGINDFENQSIFCYPNPTSGILHIDFETQAGGESIIILDIAGKICYSGLIMHSNNQINLNQLKQGMYFILIRDTNNNIIATRKIVRSID